MQGIAQEVILALKNDERSKGIETEIVIRHDSRVLSDPASIRQVLWNLLLNAYEAMPDGGKLWIELDEQPGLRVAGAVVGTKPGDIHLGAPVELCFRDLPEPPPALEFRLIA